MACRSGGSTARFQIIELRARRTESYGIQQIRDNNLFINTYHIMALGRSTWSRIIGRGQRDITKLLHQMEIIVSTHEISLTQILVALCSRQCRSSDIYFAGILNHIIQSINVNISIVPQLSGIFIVCIILFQVIICKIRTTIAAAYIVLQFISTGIHQSVNSLFRAICRAYIGIDRVQGHSKTGRS